MKKMKTWGNRMGVLFLVAVVFLVVSPVPESLALEKEDAAGIAARLAKVVKEAKANPESAAEIAAIFAKEVPEYAAEIAAAVAKAVPAAAGDIAASVARAVSPNFAPDIAGSVAEVVPLAAADIADKVTKVAPDYADQIQQSVYDAIGDTKERRERLRQRTPPPPPPPPHHYGQ